MKRNALFATLAVTLCAVAGASAYGVTWMNSIKRANEEFSHYKTPAEALVALARDPKDCKAIRTMAIDAVRHHKIEDAISLYREDVLIEPKNRDAKYQLASLLRIDRKTDEAITYYRTLTDKNDTIGQISKNRVANYDALANGRVGQ